MATIVFANPKGGVGKSTIAALFVEWCDYKKLSIDTVDGDPNQTFNTWRIYRTNEGRPIQAKKSPVDITVVDTAGTSNSAITWLQKADIVITPFKPNFADLDLTVQWFQSLNPKLQSKMLFVPNMIGQASEHAYGIEEIKKITVDAGHGRVLDGLALKNRDAVYPEVLKGLSSNFFELGSKFKGAQEEFGKLAT
ncbi:MAG: ParA family protein, partial [Minisyncoccia bacterium]